jgi:hypothetical protein
MKKTLILELRQLVDGALIKSTDGTDVYLQKTDFNASKMFKAGDVVTVAQVEEADNGSLWGTHIPSNIQELLG